jgi:hypothetical protein
MTLELRKIVYEDVVCIHLAQDTIHLCAVVDTLMNCWIL